MDLVRFVRLLWNQRHIVAAGFAVAGLVALLLTYSVRLGLPPTFESRQYHVGVASASVLLDSPSSQVADIGDPKIDVMPGVLAGRAQLLANLLAASPLKDQIAQLAGVPRTTLITQMASTDPSLPVTTPDSPGAVVKPADPRANVLRLTLNDRVPIITFSARSSAPQVAVRIAEAAVTELEDYLRRAVTSGRVPDVRKLVIDRLGEAESSIQSRGPRRAIALAVALLILGVWCAGIVATDAFVRRWRRVDDDEEPDVAPALVLELAPPGPRATASPPVRRYVAVGEAMPAAPVQIPDRGRRAPRTRATEPDAPEWVDAPERPRSGVR